ncbi:MAG: NAD(P)/FAD-dependent oxidoreductase [Alphaproteobacteria bacterium]|nr:NAD(P)/FAD-dependent oxidoreductase [Alphaproteobacteria bacterium]
MDHFDTIIVGAGLSGIGAAWHLQHRVPGRSFVILEGRDAIGGTWDLFRYPGIRSDSDMYTLGYRFKPWRNAKAIADGPSIRAYVREVASENRLDQHIRFRHLVRSASWDSTEARWTVEAEVGEDKKRVRYTCSFLFMCSGYYSYREGYTPDFSGTQDFSGKIVHPQFWPEDLDYRGKRVVVIGSGATAVTLVPELAKQASVVTMLQRSPTYMVSRPAQDKLANWLREHLPPKLAYGITRWRNVLFGMYFFRLARRQPQKVKQHLIQMVRNELGSDFDVETHFTPRYNPWDQRLCLIPDSDMFEAIRSGQAQVVTDHIDRFVKEGIKLQSGKILPADIIVTATGLKLEVLGGMKVFVDGHPVDMSKTLSYKGLMYSDVPNLASSFGYTNASWTLKCDLTCEYICRLMNHMSEHGYLQVTPRRVDPLVGEEPWLDLTSGYVQRALAYLPKQGNKRPWKLYQNYALDLVTLRYGRIDDGTLEFKTAQDLPLAATRMAAE